MLKLSLVYLLHFLYIPIVLIYAVSIGEDVGSIGLYLTLILIVCLILYVFNLGTTLLCSKYTTRKLVPFLMPVGLLIILYLPAQWMLSELDFGGGNLFGFLLVGTLIINLISYYLYYAYMVRVEK